MLDKIKELLGEELSKQVTEKLGTVELAIFNDGSVVNADKHDLLKAEHKTLQDQYAESNKKIEDITNAAGESDTLKEQLKILGEEYNTFKADTTKREANFNKGTVLKELLRKNFNPDAVDLLANTFNLDELILNEAGQIVDADSKIKTLAESKPSLKLVEVIEGMPPTDKNNPSKVDTSKMTDEEYFAYKKKEE